MHLFVFTSYVVICYVINDSSLNIGHLQFQALALPRLKPSWRESSKITFILCSCRGIHIFYQNSDFFPPPTNLNADFSSPFLSHIWIRSGRGRGRPATQKSVLKDGREIQRVVSIKWKQNSIKCLTRNHHFILNKYKLVFIRLFLDNQFFNIFFFYF